jgi:hypothetical protein
MAPSPKALSCAGPARVAVDADLRAVVARLRPSPEELLTLWPPDRRRHVVFIVRVDGSGEASVRATLREHARASGDLALVRRLRAIQGDVPVVFERADRDDVVVPWRSLADDA